MMHLKRFIEDRALTFELERSFLVRSCNANFERYLTPGKSFHDLLAYENSTGMVDGLRAALGANLEWSGEVAFPTKLGILYAEISVYPTDSGYAGIGIDVTEQALVRKKLLQQLEFRDQLIKQSPVGVFLADKLGSCFSVNDCWKEMTGLKLYEAIGDGWLNAVHPEDRESVTQDWNSFKLGELSFEREYRYQRSSQSTTYVFAKAVMMNISGVPQIFRLENDLTPLILRDQQMEHQRTQIEASARLAALGVMASGISHEINNPLTIIDGMAEVLGYELVAFPNARPKLEGIKRNVGRISSIIRSMKTLARDGSCDELESHDLRRICDEVLLIAEPKFCEHGVALTFHCNLALVPIRCRVSEIEQVLLNLLNNALDAVQESEEKWVKLEIEVHPKKFLLKVSDSGPGIPEAIRVSIFNPFFTTKAPGKGSGLGLSISKTLISANGAELYLGPSGLRTTFILDFPQTEESP